MAVFDLNNPIPSLLERHAQLEALYGDNETGNWLSGWQCDNPWIDQIRRIVDKHKSAVPRDKYHYLSEDSYILDSLREFHLAVDKNTPESFLCGTGSSTIIFTFCAWLKAQDVQRVYYIEPMFFAVHHALELFGIETRPVNARHGFEASFKVNLPQEKTILLFTDPIWYAGTSLSANVVEQISDWQRATQSLIFVDGSFQYAAWTGVDHEASAILDPSLTVRLICPTKALAAHGYRFAYATVPQHIHDRMAHIYSNIYGSASIESMAFGRAIPELIVDRTLCNTLSRTIGERHAMLRSRGIIAANWDADRGYFVFERIHCPLPPNAKLLGGSYFDQKRYPDHRRINLLSPSIHLLN
jgi:aspartate/methionine/tyrosine aminotransferase